MIAHPKLNLERLDPLTGPEQEDGSFLRKNPPPQALTVEEEVRLRIQRMLGSRLHFEQKRGGVHVQSFYTGEHPKDLDLSQVIEELIERTEDFPEATTLMAALPHPRAMHVRALGSIQRRVESLRIPNIHRGFLVDVRLPSYKTGQSIARPHIETERDDFLRMVPLIEVRRLTSEDIRYMFEEAEKTATRSYFQSRPNLQL